MSESVDKATAWDACIAAREDERAKIVAWLRADNSTCDCFARSEGECACGGWDDYKTRPILDVARDIEAQKYRP